MKWVIDRRLKTRLCIKIFMWRSVKLMTRVWLTQSRSSLLSNYRFNLSEGKNQYRKHQLNLQMWKMMLRFWFRLIVRTKVRKDRLHLDMEAARWSSHLMSNLYQRKNQMKYESEIWRLNRNFRNSKLKLIRQFTSKNRSIITSQDLF